MSSEEKSTPVLIIGGGIAGMSAGHFLSKVGIPFLLLEKSKRLGGAIRSPKENSYLMEAGPFSFLPKARVLPQLVKDWGILDQMVEAPEDIAKNRFVLKNGELFRVPLKPSDILMSKLLSWNEKLRLFLEPFAKEAPAYEETVAEFVKRRAGKGVLENMITPFVSGIVAGDSEKLSMSAMFPLFVDLERQYGSLIKAFRKRKGKKSKSTLFSFKEGMETLPKAFAKKYQTQISTESEAVDLEKNPEGFYLTWRRKGELKTDKVRSILLATHAYVSADLVKVLNPILSRELETIHYASLTVVHVVYNKDSIRHPLNGFGYLSAEKSDNPVLGSIFASSIFPGRAPSNETVLSFFVGGEKYPTVVQKSDEELCQMVLNEGKRVLGFSGEPKYFWLQRYDKAIPQYRVGHLEKIRKIIQEVRKTNGLYLAGNYFGGVSLEDTARCSEKVVEFILHDLTL